MIYIYKCKNCNNVEEHFHSADLVTNDEKDFKVNLVCSKCNVKGSMDRVICKTHFSLYSSLSVEEKREVLKKRSREHFEREIKEKFHEMNRKDYIP